MADKFFEPNTETPESQEVEKINLGGEEYTQEELTKLVGLGKIGLEAEQKYKTRLDRVWPEFQQVINEKKVLEDKVRVDEEARKIAAEEAAERTNGQTNQPRQLTTEQMRT